MIQYKGVFEITFATLCKPIHDILNYATFTCTFESGNVERKGKDFKDLDILRTKRALQTK